MKRHTRWLDLLAGTGLAAILHLGAGAEPSAAQASGPPPTADDGHIEIVISDVPAARQRFHAVMSRQPGAVKVSTLATTGSEVWHIPKHSSARVAADLATLGCNVIEVSADGMRVEYRGIGSLQLSPAQKDVLAKIVRLPEQVAVGTLSMPPRAAIEHMMTRASAVAPGEWEPMRQRRARLVLPLPGGQQVALVRTRPVVKHDEGLTWSGEVEETGERALLMLANDGALSGYFGYKGRIYAVDAAGGGVHTLAEIDPVKLPPDHAPKAADRTAAGAGPRPPPLVPPIQPLAEDRRRQLEAREITIDLMLLYTRNAVGRYLARPSRWSALVVESINESFRNSGLGNVRVRLVHYDVIDYDESDGEHFDHLYRMVDGAGPHARLKKLRDEKRADIVGLVLHSPSGCGQSTRVAAEADEAFFVVHHACAVITHSIPHEIGHILGARHDRAADASSTPFAYGHGYVNGTKWRTMMSYQAGCDGCPRIPFWSNPRVMYKGEPTGTIAEDNARVILENAERVAQFR